MSGYWLGRRVWLWIADGVLVAFGIVLLVIGDEGSRLLAAFIIVFRLVLAGVQVLVWKRQQAAAARGGRAAAPR
ncbi:hypothetical protein [Amnibacterium kyonggiense]